MIQARVCELKHYRALGVVSLLVEEGCGMERRVLMFEEELRDLLPVGIDWCECVLGMEVVVEPNGWGLVDLVGVGGW